MPQPTQFQQSGLEELYTEVGQPESPNELFNPRDPQFALMHEQPHHHMVVVLSVRGLSNKEIAETLGYTPVWVSNVLRQPWARAKAVQLYNELGRGGVFEMVKNEAPNAFFTLRDLMNDPTAPKAVRAKIATDLVQQVIGRPPESVKMDVTHHDAETLEEINKELARVQAELKYIGVN